MATKQIVLVTGGNGGIGFELVRQLLTDGSKHVLLGSRSAAKGEAAVKDLQSQQPSGTVEFLHLDVDSEASIAAAAKEVDSKHHRLDALVNNAAVARVSGSTSEVMLQTYRTNVIGPFLTVQHFAPLLRKAQGGVPRVINVSSSQGSIALRSDPSYMGYKVKGEHYRASKAALNMITACQAVEYGSSDDNNAAAPFKIFTYCPGFTVSNLGPRNNLDNGAQPTSKGAAPMVNILNGERDREHGGFVHEKGQYPW